MEGKLQKKFEDDDSTNYCQGGWCQDANGHEARNRRFATVPFVASCEEACAADALCVAYTARSQVA